MYSLQLLPQWKFSINLSQQRNLQRQLMLNILFSILVFVHFLKADMRKVHVFAQQMALCNDQWDLFHTALLLTRSLFVIRQHVINTKFSSFTTDKCCLFL